MKKYILMITIVYFFCSPVFHDNCKVSAQNNSVSDSSAYIVSAIKTIAGEKPQTELFDIFIKFNYTPRLFSLASIDVAIGEDGTDTTGVVGPSSEKLFDAGVSANWFITTKRTRKLFIGLNFRTFDSEPYLGVHFGSIELDSPLESSFLSVGYLSRVYDVDQAINLKSQVREHMHNLFFEFALHSSELPAIQDLRVKGGILFPLPFWNDNPEPRRGDSKVRIAIEVPVGGIKRFK